MNRKLRGRALMIVTSAVALVAGSGCGGEERKDAEARAGGRSHPAVGEAISLEGCVEAAPGTEQFVLTTIRLDPRDLPAGEEGELRKEGETALRAGITEWSWVELDPGNHELEPRLGQRVVVEGVVVKSGHNTIGTAGTWGYRTPSGDKSQAASDEHHAEKQKLEMGRIARESLANGTAAEIRVEQIRSTGETCTGLAPERP